MIAAIFQTMWLRLWRDKGALILAFILPGFIFSIFALVFTNASSGALDIQVAFANESTSPADIALAEALANDTSLVISTDPKWTSADVKSRIKLGQDDVGFIIQPNKSSTPNPSFLVIYDPSKDVAVTLLKGQVQNILSGQLPAADTDMFVEESALSGNSNGNAIDHSVTYYIGATAILFLLFSAMQGASLSIEERKSGITNRLMAGPSGIIKMLTGKFLFLSCIGFCQALIITAIAYVVFEIPVLNTPIALLLACLSASFLAAGLALCLASLCSTTQQMHAISTFLVLLCSAIGGSMVPSFMMPDWLKGLGRFTPNHWVIEAFYGIIAREQSIMDLFWVWIIIFSAAATAMGLAALFSHKFKRL